MEYLEKKTIYKKRVDESVEFLKHWDKGEPVPDIAIVLGSGLSHVAPSDSQMKSLSFEEIPGFKTTNAPGHKGELRVGMVSAKCIDGKKKQRRLAFLHGRNHVYEGNDPGEVVHNIRSLIQWGVKGVILTNAAGCLNLKWELGKMMLISDQINLTGLTPLLGDAGLDFGKRFVDMTTSYSHSWQVLFKATASKMKETLYDGVYCGVLGPQYETPAEIRMMQTMGAHAVGMSTVLEVIAARQMGVRVAGISSLTNYGAGLSPGHHLSHEEVMHMGNKFSSNIANIILPTVMNLEV